MNVFVEDQYTPLLEENKKLKAEIEILKFEIQCLKNQSINDTSRLEDHVAMGTWTPRPTTQELHKRIQALEHQMRKVYWKFNL